jgi:hypothetical protein
MKKPGKRGGRGMLPLGCLPLWGREGVTIPAAAENKRITGKRGFQQSHNGLKCGVQESEAILSGSLCIAGPLKEQKAQ